MPGALPRSAVNFAARCTNWPTRTAALDHRVLCMLLIPACIPVQMLSPRPLLRRARPLSVHRTLPHWHACDVAMSAARTRPLTWAAAALAIGVIVGILFGYFLASNSPPTTAPLLPVPQQTSQLTSPPHTSAGDASAAGVLVLYSFFDGDEVSWGNLLFFLQHAVHDGDGVRYVVILNGFDSLNDDRLPALPSNAEYALHRNECYDWGTYEWALRTLVEPKSFECALSRLHAPYLHRP